MNKTASREIFFDRPGSSAVLALLLVVLGCAFAFGWIEDSPQRRYFPGHEWFMTSISWLTAGYLAFCAGKGFLRNWRARGS